MAVVRNEQLLWDMARNLRRISGLLSNFQRLPSTAGSNAFEKIVYPLCFPLSDSPIHCFDILHAKLSKLEKQKGGSCFCPSSKEEEGRGRIGIGLFRARHINARKDEESLCLKPKRLHLLITHTKLTTALSPNHTHFINMYLSIAFGILVHLASGLVSVLGQCYSCFLGVKRLLKSF